jgi:hypothetical protein
MIGRLSFSIDEMLFVRSYWRVYSESIGGYDIIGFFKDNHSAYYASP